MGINSVCIDCQSKNTHLFSPCIIIFKHNVKILYFITMPLSSLKFCYLFFRVSSRLLNHQLMGFQQPNPHLVRFLSTAEVHPLQGTH